MQASRSIAVITAAVLLAGCATTFSLGNVHGQLARSADQQQLDTLVCKDQARLAASGTGATVKGFLLGLTIVGAPAGYAMDRQIQRTEFGNCMTAKGYQVTLDRS